jgi:predicted permease
MLADGEASHSGLPWRIIPTAVFAPLIAPHYKVYEAESASTLVLTALLMIVTLPLTILLTGA